MELNKKTLRSIFLGIVGCILLYWVLNTPERIMGIVVWAGNLVQPFLVGGGIAFILNVPMRAIERLLKKQKAVKGTRGIAILLTMFAFVLVIAVVVGLVFPQVEATVHIIGEQLPSFFGDVEVLIRTFLEENPEIWTWIQNYTEFENYDWATIGQKVMDFAGNSIGKVFGSAVSAVGNVINTVWGLFVSIIFAIYCLTGKEKLARQGRKLLYAYLPENWADEMIRILRLTNATFSSFLSGQCLEMIILGCLFAVVMSIMGMPYVPLVSVLVGVTSIIPIVGAWIGCVFGAFFILVNDPLQALIFVFMFLILQQIENNLIYPRVVGTSVGLPSMWVLAAVTVGGDIMGVGGMILMIPMASVLYTLLREYSTKRVERRQIDPQKLKDQPPELRSKRKAKPVQPTQKPETTQTEQAEAE